MKINILASKTGQMNMGEYSKTKTAQVYTYSFNGIEGNYFRFKYVGDSVDECFDTFDKAMNRFNEAAKLLK